MIDNKYCIMGFEKRSLIGATRSKLRNTLTCVFCCLEEKFALESFRYYSQLQNGAITILRKEMCLSSEDSFIRFWIFVNI